MATISEEGWLSVVDACNAAALDLGNWMDALAGLAAVTGSRSGQLIGFGPSAASFSWLTEVDPEWMDSFIAAGGVDPACNPRLAAGMRSPALRLLTDAEVISPQERRRNLLYAELASQDVPFICATNLIKEPGRVVGLAVLRSHSQGEIESDQFRLFASIAPHIRSAVHTQMVLEGKAAQVLTGALEALALPVFVCDSSGRVGAITAGAEALISAGDGVSLSQGRLSAGQPEETNRLTEAIRRAVIGLSQPGEPPTTTLFVRRNGSAPLVLDVISLPRRPYSFGFEPRALVVARSRQPDPQRSRLLLQTAYGLTPTETDVALQLADGQSPEVIASVRGVSVGTVRTQIRAIYAKFDVRRQIELVARLRELACI